jgi:hypothetical protein
MHWSMVTFGGSARAGQALGSHARGTRCGGEKLFAHHALRCEFELMSIKQTGAVHPHAHVVLRGLSRAADRASG